MTASYPPIPHEDWPDDIAGLEQGFAGRLNIYRVMAHHPALLAAWAPLRRHLVEQNALGPERLEVVILRTAHRLQSDYERAHHHDRARRVGLSGDRIAAIEGPLDAMRPGDAVLARAVDEMIDRARLSDATQAELHALVGKEGVFDLIATVGFYTTLGCIANSFGVPLDADIAPL